MAAVRRTPAAVAEIDEVVVAERAGVAGPGVAVNRRRAPRTCAGTDGQDAVDVPKDDPVHADAEPQRERDGEDETRVATHPFDCVAHVGAQVLEPARPTFVAHRLAITLDRAECKQRPPPRFGRRHALTNQMLGLALEVKSKPSSRRASASPGRRIERARAASPFSGSSLTEGFALGPLRRRSRGL
jgi:hypothetical protein